jgi:hypothetical protein
MKWCGKVLESFLEKHKYKGYYKEKADTLKTLYHGHPQH